MDEPRHDSDAGDANLHPGVVSDASNGVSGDASGAKDIVATPTDNIGGADVTAAISGRITYSLTIENAQERLAHAHRKVPSIRSLQRYCEQGVLQGIRTPVTYDDGNHAKPWFINEASLDAYIKTQPIVVFGDAGDAKTKVATPSREVGDANDSSVVERGDAGDANHSNNRGTDIALPHQPLLEPPSIPLSEVLLENARLEERIENKLEIIKRLEDGQEREREEWHSERDFLRTDIVDTRALARDFKSISDNILSTFKQIGSKQTEGTEKVEPGQILYKPIQPGGEARPA